MIEQFVTAKWIPMQCPNTLGLFQIITDVQSKTLSMITGHLLKKPGAVINKILLRNSHYTDLLNDNSQMQYFQLSIMYFNGSRLVSFWRVAEVVVPKTPTRHWTMLFRVQLQRNLMFCYQKRSSLLVLLYVYSVMVCSIHIQI